MSMGVYIEREAVLEAVTVWYKKACQLENMSSYNMGERAAYTTAISEIIELPAANVRPVVRGKWVQVMGKYDWMVKCSRCNGIPLETSNFCPNCGADMREEDDGAKTMPVLR